MHRDQLGHWDKKALDKLCLKAVTDEDRTTMVEQFKDADRVSLDDAVAALPAPAKPKRTAKTPEQKARDERRKHLQYVVKHIDEYKDEELGASQGSHHELD